MKNINKKTKRKVLIANELAHHMATSQTEFWKKRSKTNIIETAQITICATHLLHQSTREAFINLMISDPTSVFDTL